MDAECAFVRSRIDVCLCACSVYQSAYIVCAIGIVRESACIRVGVRACVCAEGGAGSDARLRRRTDGRHSTMPL
jgi:hypothetical protein